MLPLDREAALERIVNMKNWRVTIERRNGTFFVKDVLCATSREATVTTLTEYRAKYQEPADGESHWVQKVVEIARHEEIGGVPV